MKIHIDRDEEHLSLVYYINNCTGDTLFYELKNTYNIDNWKEIISNGEFDGNYKNKNIFTKKRKSSCI